MRILPVFSLVLLAVAPLPAFASSCAEQIGTIERRLDSAGAIAVAGLQEGHTVRTGSPRGVTAVRLDAPSDPDTVSTADHIAIARTLIVRATDEDRRGDKRACENTMSEAKGMIGALPQGEPIAFSAPFRNSPMTGHLGIVSMNVQARSIDRPRALTRRFGNFAGSRAYDLFVPPGRSGGPLPLVMMLHGCSQSSRDFAIGTRMDGLAAEQGFIVAYPDQPRSANMAKSWNWFRDGDQRRDQGEPSILAGLTRQIMNDFEIDSSRIYVAGLSSGGAAAAVMAQAYPDIYAAVGIHSGLASGAAGSMGAALSTMRRGAVRQPLRTAYSVPTIVFHGDRDTTVASINGDQAIEQSRPGTELTSTTTEGRSAGGMAFTRTVLAETHGAWSSEQWVLHGAGHAWAGGHPSGSHTDPKGPDASLEMLRFFMSHTMSAPPNMT